MLLISANNVAVDYGGRTIFSDVSLDITSGERIGLVGENGAGKSTLLRVLAGQERPDEGTVVYSKGLRLGYLVQEPHFAPDRHRGRHGRTRRRCHAGNGRAAGGVRCGPASL